MRSYRMQSYFGKIISTKLPLMDSSYDSPCTTSPSPPTLATGAHSGVIITTYIPASSSIMPNSIVTKNSKLFHFHRRIFTVVQQKVLYLRFAFPLLAVLSLHAQDTRHVTEPRFPPACTTLAARL